MEHPIRYDTPLVLEDLGRHLPRRPRRVTVWRWVRDGVQRRDLLRVKLEAFGQPLQSTLENYWRMQLRLDAGAIVIRAHQEEGAELCMAMCGVCERFHKFDVDRLATRDEALRSKGWKRWTDATWLCEKCG